MKQDLFNKKNKMADLITECHKVILILPRFNIYFGFGDKTVEEVCREYNVDSDLFLMICNIYAYPQYASHYNLSVGQIPVMLEYLRKSHSFYLQERIPHIENHLTMLSEKSIQKHGQILKQFWDQYKSEVISHFDYEERMVYPYIDNLIEGGNGDGYNIGMFSKHHSNIEDKLDDLTNIIIKYLPGKTLSQHRSSILFDLYQLSSDLKRHTYIEDRILVPAIKAQERKRQ